MNPLLKEIRRNPALAVDLRARSAATLKQESGTRLDLDQVEFCEMRHHIGGGMTLVERRAAFILASVFQEGKGGKK